jgi:hypothetical protein
MGRPHRQGSNDEAKGGNKGDGRGGSDPRMDAEAEAVCLLQNDRQLHPVQLPAQPEWRPDKALKRRQPEKQWTIPIVVAPITVF